MDNPDPADRRHDNPGPGDAGARETGPGSLTGPGAGHGGTAREGTGPDGTNGTSRGTGRDGADHEGRGLDGTDREGAEGEGAEGEGADRDGQVAEQLLRLTRRIHRIQKHQLGPVGITPAQGRLLRTVAYCVAYQGGPPRMADLAARLEVVPRAVTTLVDGLEANGWVRRAPDPANRRVRRIVLTDSGHDTLRALRTARRSAAEEVLAPLSGEQRETLGELLSALMGTPDAGGGPAPAAHAGHMPSGAAPSGDVPSGDVPHHADPAVDPVAPTEGPARPARPGGAA